MHYLFSVSTFSPLFARYTHFARVRLRKVNSGSLPGLIFLLNELYNNLYVETEVFMSLFLLLIH